MIKIILVDIELPAINGVKLVETWKNDDRFKSIPMLINSTIIDHNVAQEIKRVKADGFIKKFDKESLSKGICRVFQKSNIS